MPPKKGKNKVLIYAGVAGAVIALLVLLKKRQATGGEGEAGATYASAPGSIPAVGETTASTASAVKSQLGEFELALQAQLPEAISQGVKAGLQSSQPSQSSPNNLAELVGALGGFYSSVQGAGTGQQVGGAAPSPSAPGPAVQPAIAPAVAPSAPPPAPPPPPPPPKPAPPKPAFETIRCGNGCPGHRYPDGRAECQVRDKHGNCHWP